MALHDNGMDISYISTNGKFGVMGIFHSLLLGFSRPVIMISPFMMTLKLYFKIFKTVVVADMANGNERTSFIPSKKFTCCDCWESSGASVIIERCVDCMKLPSSALTDGEFEKGLILWKIWA